MSVFKCKMCGGSLSVQDGLSVAECEYCGTKQTISTSNDEVIVNLFNRANNLRLKGDFDKALEVYEKILDLDNTQAEAHWGVVLCKYGVEYVEDPLTKERIPTCHRTQMTSLLTDTDYQAVLQYADSTSRAVYEEQAHQINELQKKILEIVKSEKPFDVFICYKESDESGTRTKDSVIANEIYHELTNSGLKVFYSAITLEDKLGQEYEPYIFAALTSAKVMLVLGTKTEYFNAVWVKNEWSRYLHLMKADRQTKRTLIPCFRDMDAYDLPEEFSHLQALDMANIAFLPDLSRNIKKLIDTETVAGTVSESDAQPIAPLLRRAFMFLEDDEFERADDLLEMVLDQDPENAKAYLGKLMVKLHVHTEEELMQCSSVISEDPHFKKACRFADDEFRAVLIGYNQAILDCLSAEIYSSAKSLYESGEYTEAGKLFREIPNYKDASILSDECSRMETDAKEALYCDAKQDLENGAYADAVTKLQKIRAYKDSDELLCDEACRKADEYGEYGAYVRAVTTLDPYVNFEKAKMHQKMWLDAFKKEQSRKPYAKLILIPLLTAVFAFILTYAPAYLFATILGYHLYYSLTWIGISFLMFSIFLGILLGMRIVDNADGKKLVQLSMLPPLVLVCTFAVLDFLGYLIRSYFKLYFIELEAMMNLVGIISFTLGILVALRISKKAQTQTYAYHECTTCGFVTKKDVPSNGVTMSYRCPHCNSRKWARVTDKRFQSGSQKSGNKSTTESPLWR